MKIFDARIPATNGEPQPVGIISKTWSGLMKEMFTDADNFFITFPGHATPEERGLLLSALFLLNILFFEQRSQGNRNNGLAF